MENAKSIISKKDANGAISLIDKNLTDGSQGGDSKAIINYIAKNLEVFSPKDALAVCEHAV